MNPKTRRVAVKAVESFVITFLAVLLATDSGFWTAPDWPSKKAALVALAPAAITAGIRAAQVATKTEA